MWLIRPKANLVWTPECIFSRSAPQRCATVTPINGVEWTLHDGKTLVGSGSVESARGHCGSQWGRYLDVFHGTAGVTYLLRIESASELVELNSLRPIVTVAADHDQLKNHFVNASFTRDAALVLAVFGTITLGFGRRASRPLAA